jgi:hypothetical protein
MSRTLKITNGDIVKYAGSDNGYRMMSGKEKVTQDIKMIFTTSVRPTTGLGCGLDEIIGNDTMNPLSTFMQFPATFDFQNRIRIGLSRLQNAQNNYQFSQRTKSELIAEYSQVRVWPNGDDPRNFRWRVDILTKDNGNPVSISGSVA